MAHGIRASCPCAAGLAEAGLPASSVATYPGALASGQPSEALTVNGFVEPASLATAAASPSYIESLSLLTGASATQDGPGAIAMDNSSGTLIATYGAGIATDASGAEQSLGVTLLGDVGGMAVIRVSVASSWLAEPSRAFPVSLDPSFISGNYSARIADAANSADTFDTHVNSDNWFGAYDGQTYAADRGSNQRNREAFVRSRGRLRCGLVALLGTLSSSLLLVGCSYGPQYPTPDPGNVHLHELEADPVFATLPPDSKLLRPLVGHAAYQLELNNWEGPGVDEYFVSRLTPAQVGKDLNHIDVAAGWSQTSSFMWQKQLKDGSFAFLSLVFGASPGDFDLGAGAQAVP